MPYAASYANEVVTKAVCIFHYTNSQRTLRETADGLYNAWLNRVNKLKKYVEIMNY